MEGYSVTEAASVLGVPTERVWELLARGVLSGASEGETGMRVFLQPRPAPAPLDPRPNGNGAPAEPERELSPFRELLTEFRNLTERYGQALLALGEARGEVASLRSRVDLLEARMDLRLPAAPPMAPATWSPTPVQAPTDRVAMPTAPEPSAPPDETDDQPAAAPDADEQPERPARRRSAHGTEAFAEALARAQDPTAPELPDGASVAAALASIREEIAAEESDADASLPRELPAAEPMIEPEPEPQPEPEPEPVEPEPVEPSAESEPNFDPGRYTAEIEEPDWLTEENPIEQPPAVAATAPHRDEETMLWFGRLPETPTTSPSEPPAEEGGSGADEMEVAPGGHAQYPREMPGASELDRALAALDELARSAPADPSPSPASDPMAPPPSPPRPTAAPRPATLASPTTPASRAYRRLRRIFPG